MFWCRPAKLWYVKNFIIDNIRPPIHCNTVFMINNLLKLHKNARLSLFVEIGGVLYPQSTTSIANNGARSYLKKSRQALEKKNHQTDQKFPIFSLHPFPPQLCTFLLLHTHTSTLSSAVLTKVTWFLHRFELSSLIHETEKAFEDIVQYCIKEGLCYVSISRLKSFKKPTLMSCRCTPTKSLVKRNKNSHSNNHSSIFCSIRQKESGLYSPP